MSNRRAAALFCPRVTSDFRSRIKEINVVGSDLFCLFLIIINQLRSYKYHLFNDKVHFSVCVSGR